MECLSIKEEKQIEILASDPWKLILSLLGGITIGVLITLFTLYVKKELNKRDMCNCYGVRCCCCTAASVGDDAENKGSVLSLESWILVPEFEENGDTMQQSATTVTTLNESTQSFASCSATTFSTRVDSQLEYTDEEFEIQSNEGSDTESTYEEHGDEEDQSADKSFNDKKVSLAEVLSQTNSEEAAELLFSEERNALLTLESNFIQQRSDVFLFMVDVVATKLLDGRMATLTWKKNVESYCRRAFAQNEIVTEMIEYLQAMLEEETGADTSKVDEILNEFQTNWNHFDSTLAQLHLKLVMTVERLSKQKHQIVDTIYRSKHELTTEIQKQIHQHLEALELLQLTAAESGMAHLTTEELSKLREVWEVVLDDYQQALSQMRDFPTEVTQSDISQHNQCIQDWQNAVLNNDMLVEDYISAHSRLLESQANENQEKEEREIQLEVTQVSSRIEDTGIQNLKQGMTREGELYCEKRYWQATKLELEAIQREQTAFQSKLRKVMTAHNSRLQEAVNNIQLGTGEDAVSSSVITKEIHFLETSIKSIIDRQGELTETERKNLLERSNAQFNVVAVHIQLSRINQERELEQKLREKPYVVAGEVKIPMRKGSFWECHIATREGLLTDKQVLLREHNAAVQGLNVKLQAEIEQCKKGHQLLFQRQLETIRRGHERNRKAVVSMPGNTTKLFRLVDDQRIESPLGEKLFSQHQITTKVIKENIKKTKVYQEQVLQQKLQARNLDKTDANPCTSGNLKRFAANTLVGLLLNVRHRRAIKEMEEGVICKVGKIRDVKKSLWLQAKQETHQHEKEMTMKLASVLEVSTAQVEHELQNIKDL